MAELRIVIPDRLEAKLQSAMPDYLDRKGFVCLLLDNALDGTDTLGLAKRSEQASPSSSSSITSKKTSFNKEVPPSLSEHTDLIRAFWKAKSGSKSAAGWKLLMTELGKIQEKYGAKVVADQLELATAQRFKGVSLRNYEQFGIGAKAAAKEPEPRHPAYRVFTADNGFGDNDPTTNPILEQLF